MNINQLKCARICYILWKNKKCKEWEITREKQKKEKVVFIQ